MKSSIRNLMRGVNTLPLSKQLESYRKRSASIKETQKRIPLTLSVRLCVYDEIVRTSESLHQTVEEFSEEILEVYMAQRRMNRGFSGDKLRNSNAVPGGRN